MMVACTDLNNLRFFFLVSLLFLGSGTVSQAASFDCNKAATETEKAICADPELGQLDEEMGLQWSQMSSLFPRSNQIHWIERRDKCDNTSCIRRAIEERIFFLKEINKIIGNYTRLTCRIGESIISVNIDGNGYFILMITDEYFTKMPAEWNYQGSGVCRAFDYTGYEGATNIKIEEEGRCSSGELPFEVDLVAHVSIGSLYFKCRAVEE